MLNIRESEDKKVYITSDLHMGHQKDFVWKDRGYENPRKHDEGLIDTINEIVRPNDILMMLGDFCLNTTVEQFEKQIESIKCQNVYMMWGNHPNPHFKNIYKPLVKKILGINYVEDSEVYPLRYKNIIYIGNYAEVILNGQFIVLSHYPIYIFNEMAHGSWMLCGHSHNGCPLTKVDNTYGKILDVGWDGHGMPWSFEEIATVMDGKRFAPLDEHHK
jgi:calcineurin-like phosphoesterase family protein